jgi:hypothetical protein
MNSLITFQNQDERLSLKEKLFNHHKHQIKLTLSQTMKMSNLNFFYFFQILLHISNLFSHFPQHDKQLFLIAQLLLLKK